MVMLVTSIVLVISWLAWKVFLWVWWKPMKLQRYLREQGIRGPSYRLFFGNLKKIFNATKEARSKPMELSHRIVPQVIPFIDQTVPQYGLNRRRAKMEDAVFVILITTVVLLSSWAWKALSWIWWKPMRLQKYLREQGIRGAPYKLLHGDLKENRDAIEEAKSKPMELSHHIVPRVMPFLHQTIQKYGRVSLFWFGPIPRVLITEPDLVREILSNKSGHFSKVRINPLGSLLIGGLVSYNGEKWAKHRRIINPAFHIEKLKMMLPAFYTCCDEMVSKWQTLVSDGPTELDVWPEFHNLSGDVISRAAFGSSYKEGRRIFQLQNEQTVHVSKATQSIYIPGSWYLPTQRNKRMAEIHNEVNGLLRSMIQKREKAIKMGEADKDDLLGLLMESNSKEIQDNGNSKKYGMSVEDVIEECKLFYFAGQETTSILLTWTMIVLSMHLDWQDQAREEVLCVFGKSKPDFDGLNHLKIVTMILYEVLRLYPSVVMLTRGTYKPMKVGDITLPQGVQIMLPTLIVHHDREFWGDDAEEFNPTRFSEGVSKANKNGVSFFPFGWGPRICIGQTFALVEAKMALAMILQKFRFELSSAYIHAPCTVLTLRPQHGAQLVFHKL